MSKSVNQPKQQAPSVAPAASVRHHPRVLQQQVSSSTLQTLSKPANTLSPAVPADARAEDVITHVTFDDMQLSDAVLRGIYAFGFEQPSVIQQQAIVPIKRGRDVIMQAQSGTGKTGAFTVGVLERIDVSRNTLQALILAPTRELAQQTEIVVAALGDRMGVRTHCAIGGQSTDDDVRALRAGVHVVCGTPGRIYDLIAKRRALKTEHVVTLVLDEVDVMLSEGFDMQVRDIFQTLPQDVQAVAVSATFTPAVVDMAHRFLRDPVEILLPVEDVPLDAIKQYYVDCGRYEEKFSVICDLFQTLSVSKTVIFCNTRESGEHLCEQLTADDHSVSLIHSDMSQADRKATMKDFRHGDTRVLIATDLLARGIDVQQVSMVVNYDLPRDKANYIHRVGRGGRHGRSATAINLIAGPRDEITLAELQAYYNIRIPELPATIAL